jgi:enterochelin esterase family protein
MDAEAPTSPRLAALERAIAGGDHTAIAAFWDEVARAGTPLVEPVEGDADPCLVTFLWRGAGAAAVALQSPAGGVDPAKNQLALVPGTDVWYRACALPAGTRMQYEIGVAASREALDRGWDAFDWQVDPLNPHRHTFPSDDEGTFRGYPVSVLELPGAPAQPWIAPRADVPTGTLEQRRVSGPAVGDRRRLWLYAPAVGPPTGLVVLFDGWTYAHGIPTASILDNLIAAGRIPPIAGLLIDNPDRRRELAFDERFTHFVADELVPLARSALGVPAEPAGTIVGGSSLGGVAAVFAALRRPDLFGNVLSQSGAFWCKGPDGRYEWLTREAARLAPRPVRFYLDAGVLEGRQFEDAPTQAEANRNLRDVLRAKGCPVHYVEFAGGHDPLCWRGTLADGLIALVDGAHER